MISITTTDQAATLHGVKLLVYGPPGAGKTRLCATTGGNPIIISAEAGLLSLRGERLPVIQVATMQDVLEAYRFLAGAHEGKQFDWVCVDSISEIAEVVLTNEKKAVSDGRAAYGNMADKMGDLVRAFRDLPGRNVYMSAKMERIKDEVAGSIIFAPSMPGNKFSQALPYMFDEVMALRVEQDQQGNPFRVLQTSSDLKYMAKDRSGALAMWEPPNLHHIRSKILPSFQPNQQAA